MAVLLKNSPFDALSSSEIEKYFNLLDMSSLPEKERETLKNNLLNQAEQKPFLRRLIRDKIAHNQKINITATADDLKYFESEGALGVALEVENRVAVNIYDPTRQDISGTLYHELLHIDQFDKKLWLNTDVSELARIGNKINEAEAISVTYLCELEEGGFFHKLLQKETKRLDQAILDEKIPYADNLTQDEKKKARSEYISGLATENAIGQSIALLTQENGAKTAQVASQLGIELSAKDLDTLHEWRSYYNKQSQYSAQGLLSQQDVGLTVSQQEEFKRVQSYYENKYPVLKNHTFMTAGLTKKMKDEVDHGEPTLPKTGREFVFHPNKKISYTAYFDKNGFLHGSEIYLDQDMRPVFSSTYQHGVLDGEQKKFTKDEKTGKIYLSQKNIYQNGTLKQETYYQNETGVETTIQYQDKNNYSSQTKNKNGQLIDFYQIKDGKLEGPALSEDENFFYESTYQNGKMISLYQRDKKTKKLVKESHLEEGVEPPIYQTTFYKKGVKSSFGYQSASDKKIGRWINFNPDQKNTTLFYDGFGNETKDLALELKKQGYQQNDDNKALYELKTDKGSYLVYLSEKTGLIEHEGAINQKGEYVGKWIEYSALGVEQKHYQYDQQAQMKSIDTLNPNGDLNERILIHQDGTETAVTYWKKDKIRTVFHYEPQKDNHPQKDLSYLSFHIDGGIYEHQEEKKTITTDTKGNLLDNSEKSSLFSHSVNYYPNKPEQMQSLTLESALQSKTTFRKDGSISSLMLTNATGDGRLICYGPNGKIRSFGPVKNYKKDGIWTYQLAAGRNPLTRYVVYQDGKRTTNEVSTPPPSYMDQLLQDIESGKAFTHYDMPNKINLTLQTKPEKTTHTTKENANPNAVKALATAGQSLDIKDSSSIQPNTLMQQNQKE